MVKLSPQIQEFAEALEEIHAQEIKKSFVTPGDKKIAPVASVQTIHRRGAILAQVVTKREGVKMEAARLGYAAFACWLVGNDTHPAAQGELFQSAKTVDFTEHLKEEERLREELQKEADLAKEEIGTASSLQTDGEGGGGGPDAEEEPVREDPVPVTEEVEDELDGPELEGSAGEVEETPRVARRRRGRKADEADGTTAAEN